MKVREFFTSGIRRMLAVTAIAVGLVFTSQASGQINEFDDFEGLTLVPFTAAGGGGLVQPDLGQEGLDWTKSIRSGTNREWTIDNSLMGVDVDPDACPAYYGWSAWNWASYFNEQGDQGRGSECPALATEGNTVLVADPDAMDDFSNVDPALYDGAIYRTYTLTGDLSQTEISFLYEFRNEDLQEGWIEVSFDDGATWQLLEKLGPFGDGIPEYQAGCPATYSVANGDFTADSDTMLLRFRCKGGNDWWFAVDDILVTTDTFSDFEDFEGLELEQFFYIESGAGDGTDWTNDIPNWDIDNSNNLGFSEELAYDGWTAMDVASWIDEQGGQGRSLFNALDPNNTILVADGDAFYDYDFDLTGENPAPPQAVNTYISREYDVSGTDNCTIQISFLYEFRIYNAQTGVVEASFDGGNTWNRMEQFDLDDGSNSDFLLGQGVYNATVDFDVLQSNTMILRFGYLTADNDWWFAVDDVAVTGDAAGFIKGDIDGDGFANTLDINPFVALLLDPNTEYDPSIDFNCDGQFNTLDIQGFVNILLGN